MKKTSLFALLFSALVSGTPVASASTVAVTFSGGELATVPTLDSWTVGYNFTPKSAIVIDGFGFYDHGSDGLSDSHRIGLWNLTQNALMTEATITTANSTLAGPTLNNAGQFRFVDIAPMLLVPKYDYNIGAQILAGQEDLFWFAGMNVDFYDWDTSLIDSAGPAGFFTESDNLALPSISVGQRYGIVSFRARLATIGDIPSNFPVIDLPPDFPIRRVSEPGMLALIGLGLAGLAIARRRSCSSR
jgi:hypothetical protein